MNAHTGMHTRLTLAALRWLLVLAFAQALLVGAASGQAAPAAAAPAAKLSPVAPRKEQVQAIVNEAYAKFKGETRGKNADYIPELAKVDSKLFGIAVVSTDNATVTAGDVKTAFSIQ